MQTESSLRKYTNGQTPVSALAKAHSPVHIIFGNHGTGVQLEDYFDLLEGLFTEAGIPYHFSAEPVANALNVLIECFDDQFASHIEKLVEKAPRTRFVCICTEFLTESTFNEFSPDLVEAVDRAQRSERRLQFLRNPVLLPILRWIRKLAPNMSRVLSQVIYPTKNGLNRGWLRRYQNFQKIQSYCEFLWCISPHQLQEYQRRFGYEKIQYLPIVSFSKAVRLEHSDASKDIDFLFSGTMTPYRKAVINQLSELGYKVEVGFWHSRIRDHYLKRSKICLHIRQDSNWAYPSIMRYHKLLVSGNVIVAESCPEACEQEKYTRQSSIENFVANCVQEYELGNFSARGEIMAQKYYDGIFKLREQAIDTIRKIVIP